MGLGGSIPTVLGQGNGTSSISFATNTSLNRSAAGGGRGASSFPSGGVVSAAPGGSGGCGGGGPSDCTFSGFNANGNGGVIVPIMQEDFKQIINLIKCDWPFA
jgi:hypothetical protein